MSYYKQKLYLGTAIFQNKIYFSHINEYCIYISIFIAHQIPIKKILFDLKM